MISDDADYIVTGYNVRGEILVRTWHIGIASMEIEMSAWKTRVTRPGDVAAYVTVLNRNTGELMRFP